jgi:hypothetical protein
MKQKRKPISYAPEHRPAWRRFRRWCTCGLRWPCPDRFTGRADVLLPPANDPHWSAAAMHVRDTLGFCTGCLDLWGHLTRYPCSVTIWAAYLLVGRYPS